MRIVSIRRPATRSSASITQRYFSARLSRQQRTIGADALRHGLPGASAEGAGRARAYRRRAGNLGASGSIRLAERRGLLGQRQQLVPTRTRCPRAATGAGFPASATARPTFLSRRIVPADAALVGEVERQRGIAQDRLRGLDAHQAPGAAADIGAALIQAGDGRHRAGGVVAAPARSPARAPRSPTSLAHVRQQLAQRSARGDDRRQDARRQAEPVEQIGRPAPLARDRSICVVVALVYSTALLPVSQ